MYESNMPEIIKYLTEDDLKLMYGRLNRRFVVVDALPAVSSLEPADKNVIYVVKETDGGVERYWPNVLEDNVWKPVGIVQEDLNGKIDKVSAEEGHLVVADENGNLADAGLMPGTFVALAYDPSEQIQPHATDFRKIWCALQSGIPVILLDNRESGTGLYASLNAAGYTWPDGDHMAERVTDVDTDYRPHDDSIPGYYDSENGKFYYDIYHAIEIDPVDGVVYHDLVDDKVYLYADEAFIRVLRFVQFSANELINDDPVWTSRKAARPVFFRIFEPETSATANNFYVVYGDSASSVKVDLEKKADKVLNAVSGHLAALDSTGNLVDSRKKASDFATAEQGAKADTALQEHQDISGKADKSAMAITDVAGDPTKKNIKLKDGLATTVVTEHAVTGARIGDGENLPIEQGTIVIPESATVNDGKLSIKVGNASPVVFSANDASDKSITVDKNAIDLGDVDNTADLNKPISTATQTALDKKADKVAGATNGNFAALDANGNLADSHAKIDDFATAAQGAKADTAYQKPDTGIPKSDLASDVQDSLGKADTALQEHQDISGKAEKSEMAITAVSGDETKKNIQLKDGLATDVVVAHQDISGKAEKSEMAIDDVAGDSTKKKITLKTGLSQEVVVEHQDLSGKADKVNSATSGNFAGLDANGNLTDSGKKTADFATAAQGKKADTAIQGVTLNGSTLTPDSAKVVDLGNLKTKQTAVADPQAFGEGLTFIDQTAQNENGVLTTLTKKTVQSASTSQKGVVQLQDSIASNESSTTTAPTPRAVREAISNAVASAYHHAGTKVVADLTSLLLVAENEGCVYNMTDAGTTTADFIEGAGKPIRIGDNVGVCKVSSSPDAYKFDLLSGFVDLSNYKTKQTPVSSPSPDGSGISFIDSVSQNENGELDVHSKNIQYGNTSQKGIVQLNDAVDSTSVTTAATPNSVKQAYDLANSAVKGVQKNGTDIVLDQNKKANVIVNDKELKIKLGSANAVGTGFTADANEDVIFEIPRASFDNTQTPTTYTDGLMTGEEKEKLNGIAAGAEVNSIESITIEGDQSALPISQENVTIPKAKYSGSTYTSGVITGQDKKKLDEIEDGAQVNDIEHIKIEGETADLTITDKRVTLPLAASATTSPVASAKAGIMSASDKDKLDGIELSADVNIIEGVQLDGEQNPLTPDASKVVTIPEAAVDSSGATPVYTHGLMSATDKEALEHLKTLKNFSKVTISDGATPTPSTADCEPSNDHDTLTLEAGHNIALAKDTNSNKVTITASADPVTVSAGAGIEITETPIQGGGTDYEVGVKGGHMGYLIDTAISVSHIKNGDDIIIPVSASNPISTSGDDRFVIYNDATSGHNYLAALKPIPASGSTPAVAGVDLFTLSVNINVAYMPRGNGYFYRAGVNIHDVGNNVVLSQSVETYPSQVGECSVDQTFTIKNTSNNTVTIDGKEYCCYRITYVGESDTTQDDPAGNAHVSLTAHVSAMEIAVGIIEHTGSGSTLGAGEAISIANDLISVKHGDGLGINSTTGNLEVKLGSGLKFDTTGSAEAVVTLDNPTEEVVQAVQKMQTDLDTKLTTNFAMPQITHVYDFADRSVSTLASGACMLCQAFTVPINNGIRLEALSETPTVFGIYAKQAFSGHKIMLALYVYDFETGATDYVADTGPVEVVAGRNEFPIKHINPNINELRSDCVYYASLYLPSEANVNGLLLCGCESYSSASQINAIPRFTVGVENITYNGAEISMTDASVGRLDYNDGNGTYYIGPWSNSYNEHPNAPRFFMQIRNGAGSGSVATDPFVNITGYSLSASNGIVNIFQSTTVPLSPDGNDLVMQSVKPAKDVTITEWTFYDTNASDSNNWGARVYTSGFDTELVNGGTVTSTHTQVSGTNYYEHKYVYSTGLALRANTSYWFPAGVAFDGSDKLVQYTGVTVKKNLAAFDDGANVPYYYVRENNAQGTFLKLKDSSNNEWTI